MNTQKAKSWLKGGMGGVLSHVQGNTCDLEHRLRVHSLSRAAHPRAGELRSAPSGPDDWGRVAGKRALAPLGGARSQGHNTGLRAPRLAPRCRVRTRFPLNCSFRHVRATVVRSRCKKVSAARSPSQLALSQLGTDTRDRCAAARVGTFKKQKEATVPAVTATLAPDVRVTVRKELLRRVDFAIFWFTTLSILVGAALLFEKGLATPARRSRLSSAWVLLHGASSASPSEMGLQRLPAVVHRKGSAPKRQSNRRDLLFIPFRPACFSLPD